MTVKFGHIILLIMIVLAVSCSKDDSDIPGGNGELPPETTAIVFAANEQQEQTVTRANEADKMTRASTPLSDNGVKTFMVWGFKNMDTGLTAQGLQTVFPGYTVNWMANSANTSTTNSNGWEYTNQQPLGKEQQTIKYWDWSAKAYRFFGVAGADETSNVTGKLNTAGDVFILTYRANANVEETIPYYSRLWFSTGNIDDYPNKQFGRPVQLEFIKPLSKVRILFIFEDPSKEAETRLTNMDFRPSDGNTIKLEGNVTVSYPLTGNNGKETFTASADAEGMTAFTEANHLYTVFPAPSGQSAYDLKIDVNGETKPTTVPAAFMTWLPGYQYTYIFKIHIDGSVSIDSVQLAFTEWHIQEGNHTVYNW